MYCRLFVAYEYMVEFLVFASCIVIQLVEDRHDGSSRIAEYSVYSLCFQGAHQYFCSCYSIFCHTVPPWLVDNPYAAFISRADALSVCP